MIVKLSSSLTRCMFGYLLFFISINLASADDFPSCENVKIANVNGSIPSNITCLLKFDAGKESKTKNFAEFLISGLLLQAKDNLTIKINGTDQNIKTFGDGLIVVPKSDTYEFTIKTSLDKGYRKYETFTQLNDKSKPSIQKFDTIVISINSLSKLDNPIKLTNNDNETAILLSTDNLDVTVASTNDNEQPKEWINLNDNDFLTQDKIIQIQFDLTKSKDNLYHFNLMKVNKKCSKTFSKQQDLYELKTIDKNSITSQSNYKCAYLINSTNLQIYKFDFKNTSSFDTIFIKDGLKLTSSKYLINSGTKDVSTYLNPIDKTVSSGRGILVVISSSIFNPDEYVQNTITIKKSSILKFDKEIPNLKISSSAGKETIYIFSLPDRHPVLKLNEYKILDKTNLSIYFGKDLSVEPVLRFTENEKINNELWSNTNTLVLKFNGSKDFSIDKVDFLSKNKSCNSLLSSQPITYILNGDAIEELQNESCGIYFKPLDTSYSVILNIESLILDPSNCLSLKNVTSEKNIFELCQKDGTQGSLQRMNLPEIILSSKDSYVLTYKFSKTFKPKILLQSSFAYNSLPPVRQFNLTKDQPTQTITSYNYPSVYPYILAEDLDYVSSDSNMYVSFPEYNIRKDDELKSFNSKFTYTYNTIDDFIIVVQKDNSSTLPFSLITNKFDSNRLLSDSFASGFRAEFERVDCVLTFDQKTNILQFPKTFNGSKCISVIDLSNQATKERGKYLDLTITSDRDGDNFGQLTIVDDSTRNRIVNLTQIFNSTILKNNKTINLNATSTKIIIIFERTSEQVTPINGFQLKIQPKDCPLSTCDGGTRCVLESTRCNYVAECRDLSDEYGCSHNGTVITKIETIYVSKGLNGWLTVFLMLISIGIGALSVMYGPKFATRFRSHRSYHEFNAFSENA